VTRANNIFELRFPPPKARLLSLLALSPTDVSQSRIPGTTPKWSNKHHSGAAQAAR